MQVFVPCHQVNLKAHHVDYNRFYIPDITSLVDIQEDYLKWFLSKAEIVSHVVSLPCHNSESTYALPYNRNDVGIFFGCGVFFFSACHVHVLLKAPTHSMGTGKALFWYSFMSSQVR